MANYKKVAEQILSTVGGAENVASVTHCMTRLRFNLKDESLSNDEKLEDISSIISVVHAGGQGAAGGRAHGRQGLRRGL